MTHNSGISDSIEGQFDSQVDACGLMCPQPVIRSRLALNALRAGQTLEVLATDPHTELDLEVFCATAGHQLALVEKCDSHWRFLITKG